MALCWTKLFLFAVSIFALTAETTFTLSNELTNFIPTCAQQCFISFLDVNFANSSCGEDQTLDCFCHTNTTTGYTIGEGAVQCLLGEVNAGFCKGSNASQSTISKAFHMCDGQSDALPNTHGTITATLIIESSRPGIVIVAPTSGSTMSTSIVTTTMPLISATSTPSTTLPESSIAVSTSTSSTSSATVTTGSINTTASAVTAPPPTKLTQNQIIGIGAGIAGAGLICVSLIMIIWCLQRRKTRRLLEARDSGSLPFQMEPEFYGMVAAIPAKTKVSMTSDPERRAPIKIDSEKVGGARAHAPPIPTRLEISTPNMFSRRSVKPDTIGLAISPDQSVAAPERTPRRSSKLLPEKPSLKLTMPPPKNKTGQQGLSFAPNVKPVSAVSRQSTATQFELDEDSADTALSSANGWGRGSTERILNNNDSMARNWESDYVLDSRPPPAAIAVMRPDEFHWRPPSTSPTTNRSSGGRNFENFSQPRRADENTRAQASQRNHLPIPEEPRAVSSVYSACTSIPDSDGGRNIAPRKRLSYGQAGPYDTAHSEPVRHAGTANLAKSEREESRYADLSPVVESPASGKSPVSYPKIPKRLSNAEMLLAPPPQPDFTKVFGASGMKPWRQAEVVAQRDRETHGQQNFESNPMASKAQKDRGLSRFEDAQESPSEIQVAMLSPRQGLGHQRKSSIEGGGPPVRTFSFPAPPQPSQARPSVVPVPHSIPQSLKPGPRQLRTPSPRLPQSPPPALLSDRKPLRSSPDPKTIRQPTKSNHSLIPFTLSTSPHPPNFVPLNPNLHRSSTFSGPSSNPNASRPSLTPLINPLSAHPSVTFTRSSSLVSQSSKISSNSNASSLLAKRRGEKQVKEMMLQNEEDKKRQAAKWRVLDQEGIEEAKKEGWKPRLGSPAAAEFRRGAEGASNSALVRDESGAIKETVREFAFERTELPRTPGWVPKLTPTRRGDDLFLNVA